MRVSGHDFSDQELLTDSLRWQNLYPECFGFILCTMGGSGDVLSLYLSLLLTVSRANDSGREHMQKCHKSEGEICDQNNAAVNNHFSDFQ